jgi:hypothetical protein
VVGLAVDSMAVLVTLPQIVLETALITGEAFILTRLVN